MNPPILALFFASMLLLGSCMSNAHIQRLKDAKVKAPQGDAESQAVLGGAYYHGRGIQKDKAEAVKWLRKAADQGHAEAQSLLGLCYLVGDNVPENAPKGAELLRQAAEKNSAGAQFWLGMCYDGGEGVSKDAVEAYKWVQLAAAHGFPTAKWYLTPLAEDMTPEQIAQAQKLSREWKPKAAK